MDMHRKPIFYQQNKGVRHSESKKEKYKIICQLPIAF